MNSSRRRKLKKPGVFQQTGFLAPRPGATLTEVLMALLIMAVGIVSVFTLFPISILLSIQSTKLTNARIHKNNVEQFVYSNSALLSLHGPSTFLAGTPHVRGAWQPLTEYQPGDICVPSVKPGTAFPSPNRWFVCMSVTPAAASAFSGAVEPKWNAIGSTFDDNGTASTRLTWAPLPILPFSPMGLPVDPSAAGSAVLLPSHQYVIDPLGVNVALAEGNLEHAFEFGNKTDSTMAYGASLWTAGGGALQAMPLLRINCGLQSEFAAVQVATLPDSWETAVEAVPIDLNRDTSGAYPTRYAEFPPTLDLSGVAQTLATLQAQIGPAGLAAISPRIVLTTADGQMTAVRTLDVWRSADATANRRVHWSDLQPLPAAFLARDIGPARIEVFDRRYTWLMTVRKSPIEWDIDASGGPPGQFEDANLNGRFDRGDPNATEIKLVVVFKRAFSAADEHVFDANFGNGMVTPFDGAGPVQSNEVVIQWAGAEPEPHIKPGNFLFDARDVTWYQIESFTSNAAGTARITLDRPVRAVTQDVNGDNMIDATNDVMGRAILMRGVVEVFDL